MLGVVVVYLGLIATFLGGVSLLRPLTFLAIHSRRQAALILALGFIIVVIGESLPAKGYASPRHAHSWTSLRPCTSLVSSTPSGFQRRKRSCIAPSS